MTVHRFHNPRLITVRAIKPPIARGHRSWLRLRDGIEARSGETLQAARPRRGESPALKGRAQGATA